MPEPRNDRVQIMPWLIRAEHDEIPFDQILLAVIQNGEIRSLMICKPNEAAHEPGS